MNKDEGENAFYWKSFLAGDKEAFAHYYNIHIDALYRYGTKLCTDENLIKDAIQEIFLELYLKRNQYKINPSHLRFYLILTLKHNMIKKIKRNRRLMDESYCKMQFEPEYSIETNIINEENKAEVNQKVKVLLDGLPEKQKEVLYLRFNEGLGYQEIAKILKISVESARKQVYRAIRSIRSNMDNQTFILWTCIYSTKIKTGCTYNK